MVILLVALIWGFSEASFFFIVPDVWLMGLVFHKASWKELSLALLCSCGGALLGGMIMYYWGNQASFEQMVQRLDWVPGISPSFIEQAYHQMESKGFTSFFLGAFTGVPYKIYASLSGAMEKNFVMFLVVSLAARGIRFIASMALACMVNSLGQLVFKKWDSWKFVVFGLSWLVFYIFYFIKHPG